LRLTRFLDFLDIQSSAWWSAFAAAPASFMDAPAALASTRINSQKARMF
jgi:hypothetical protein